MGRIGILTLYYKNYNYGGQLQAYALWRLLNDEGFECEQISFVRDRKKLIWRKIRGFFEEPVTKDIISVVLRKIHDKNFSKNNIHQRKTEERFDEFMNDISHSSTVDGKGIKALENNYDLFVVGSDQVWNPLFVTDEFFFDFLSEGKPRISYAASIRINKYERREGKKIKKLLEKFDYISVREHNAIDIIREIGVEKPIEIMPDPTFLLNSEQWLQVACPVNIYCEYILVYLVRDDLALRNISEYAKESGLKVVLISEIGFEERSDDIFMGLEEGIGPAEFVWLIDHARLVIANSFHGTAFSIIFNKNFYVYGNADTDDRKGTLLKKYHLTERMIPRDYRFSSERFENIDYSFANHYMDEERKNTLSKLKSVIWQLMDQNIEICKDNKI